MPRVSQPSNSCNLTCTLTSLPHVRPHHIFTIQSLQPTISLTPKRKLLPPATFSTNPYRTPPWRSPSRRLITTATTRPPLSTLSIANTSSSRRPRLPRRCASRPQSRHAQRIARAVSTPQSPSSRCLGLSDKRTYIRIHSSAPSASKIAYVAITRDTSKSGREARVRGD